MNDRRKADRRVSPAVAEFALQERGELLARIAELEAENARQVRITSHWQEKVDALETELAPHRITAGRSMVQQPSAVVVSGFLTECFFHALPDEDDWEVHDPRHMSGDCEGCVRAVIVSRDTWGRLNPCRAQSVPDTYTCIGKGGEYKLVGMAIGAGTLKEFNYMVYRNKDGVMFAREPEDFLARMEKIAAPSAKKESE